MNTLFAPPAVKFTRPDGTSLRWTYFKEEDAQAAIDKHAIDGVTFERVPRWLGYQGLVRIDYLREYRRVGTISPVFDGLKSTERWSAWYFGPYWADWIKIDGGEFPGLLEAKAWVERYYALEAEGA